MFNISKIKPKSLLGLVKAQKFSRRLQSIQYARKITRPSNLSIRSVPTFWISDTISITDLATVWHQAINCYNAVRETNAHPLASVSKFWAGWVENWPGQVEFYIEHTRVICFQANTLEVWLPTWLTTSKVTIYFPFRCIITSYPTLSIGESQNPVSVCLFFFVCVCTLYNILHCWGSAE